MKSNLTYMFSSPIMPRSLYTVDLSMDEDAKPYKIWQQKGPLVQVNPEDFSVEITKYESKDGTKVPIYIFGKKSVL